MMKKMKYIPVVLAVLLSGCHAFEKQHQAGAKVEVNGHYLYGSTLDALTLGLSPQDSARIAEQYISQWAKDMLVYDNARAKVLPELESLVEDYRRTLYVHAYEEYLIERRMPKTVADSAVEKVYNQMPDRFKLDESILKGMLVVVPNDAPKIETLRKWLTQQSLDDIEKYAYQNASGYELFTDKWLTTTDLISRMPIERTEMESRLRTKDQIEVSDSLKTYIVQVTGKHLRGEQMPVEYARPQIERIILSGRQVEFLQSERERLYEEAVESGEVKFYE